jgi:hypothetical protein
MGVSDGLFGREQCSEKCNEYETAKDSRNHSEEPSGKSRKRLIRTWIRHENRARRNPQKSRGLDQEPGYRATHDDSETGGECQTCDF